MFTGIIQGVGEIEQITLKGGQARLRIWVGDLIQEVKTGDSVAVSGVCLTAVAFVAQSIEFDVIKTTLDRTRLGKLGRGSKVNLEPALRLSDRLGGHLVSGHIDGVGTFRKISQGSEEWRFTVDAPSEVMPYLIDRGSVALDGISLTVAHLLPQGFEVSIIPHTLKETTLGTVRVNDPVNLEGDMIGRWVAKYLTRIEGGEGLTMDKLREEGFYIYR
ncbi:MAG: riboflavin synthase [Planctomycetota bacterium]